MIIDNIVKLLEEAAPTVAFETPLAVEFFFKGLLHERPGIVDYAINAKYIGNGAIAVDFLVKTLYEDKFYHIPMTVGNTYA